MSMSEAAIQQLIRAEAPRIGVTMWRNNQGACYDESKRLVRYGLGHDSAQLNARWKSSDLIGITPMVITPELVGCTVGVFTAVEVKHEAWSTPSNDREHAQKAFIDDVIKYGGLAGFANSVARFKEIVGR